MDIAICDDEKIIRECLKASLQDFCMDRNINLHIIEFSSGEEVLTCELNIDILFLDVNLTGVSGIEVKNQLQYMDNIHNIFFISGYSEYIWHAFSKKTLGYIKKPLTDAKVNEALNQYIKMIEMDVLIEIPVDNGIKCINTKDIIYICAENVYIELITKDSTYLLRDSLKNWEFRLKYHSFVRIHKSYMVNLNYIHRIDGYKLILDNGEQLNIGRTKLSVLKKEYLNFQKKNVN